MCHTELLNRHKIHLQVILWLDLVPNCTQLQKYWKSHHPPLFSRRWRVAGREAMINASSSSVDWLDFYQPLPHSSFYSEFSFSTGLHSCPAASCRKHQNTHLLYPERKNKQTSDLVFSCMKPPQFQCGINTAGWVPAVCFYNRTFLLLSEFIGVAIMCFSLQPVNLWASGCVWVWVCKSADDVDICF